jgi:S-DNA-T family DNA segregation ATPase FtsK/SpoIIIE
MALIVCVYRKDCCWQLVLDRDSSVTIGASENDSLFIPDSGLQDTHLSFVLKGEHYTLTAKAGVFSNGTEVSSMSVSVGDIISYGDIQIYIAPKQADYERSVNLSPNKEYLLGRSKDCTFCLSNKRVGSRHAKITFESGRYKLIDLESKNHTFVNGKQISIHYLNDGDIISICYFSIIFENGELSFLNTGNDLKINLDEKYIVRRYPLFRRSPRLGHTHEDRPIEIQQPSYSEEKPQINWLVVLLPPLVMVGVAIATMVLSDGGLTNLLFILPMTLVTILTTVI